MSTTATDTHDRGAYFDVPRDLDVADVLGERATVHLSANADTGMEVVTPLDAGLDAAESGCLVGIHGIPADPTVKIVHLYIATDEEADIRRLLEGRGCRYVGS